MTRSMVGKFIVDGVQPINFLKVVVLGQHPESLRKQHLCPCPYLEIRWLLALFLSVSGSVDSKLWIQVGVSCNKVSTKKAHRSNKMSYLHISILIMILPSGKRLHYGKSPFFMGKLTINGHLVVWNIWIIFPFSWEFHHPNWRTPSFSEG